MKNLILGIVLFCSMYSYGQDTKKFNYQLNAGSTLSIPLNKQVVGPYGIKTKYYCDAGFFAEMNFIYNIKNRYSLVSGINYDYNNLRRDDVLGIETLKGTIYSQHIDLPIEFKFKIASTIPLYIGAGGYIGTEISKREKGTRYIDFSMLHPIDPNDPLLNNLQIKEMPYSATYHNGFTLTYGLSARVDYTIKMNYKIGLVVFSKCSYGWNNPTEDFFETKKDMSFNFKLGLGIKI